MRMCLQPHPGEIVLSPVKAHIPVGFASNPLSQRQPLTHHHSHSPHSPCYMFLYSLRRLLKILVSQARRKENAMAICPKHLIHLAIPDLPFWFVSNLLWSGLAGSGHTWDTQMFSFLDFQSWKPNSSSSISCHLEILPKWSAELH